MQTNPLQQWHRPSAQSIPVLAFDKNSLTPRPPHTHPWPVSLVPFSTDFLLVFHTAGWTSHVARPSRSPFHISTRKDPAPPPPPPSVQSAKLGAPTAVGWGCRGPHGTGPARDI